MNLNLKTTPLKCGTCKGNLSGGNNSVVFFCTHCGIAYNTSDEGLKRYRLIFTAPKITREFEQVYLPFWRFESEYRFNGFDIGGSRGGVGLFFIPAFFMKYVKQYGDLGFWYLQKRVVPEPGQRQEIEIFPADRDIQRAANYPYIYLARSISQRGDAAPPDIGVTHKNASALLIPFYHDKKQGILIDSQSGIEFPSGVFI